MKFTKIQANGNGYLFVDANQTKQIDLSLAAKKYCDARFGVGADGIISVEKRGSNRFFIEIFNADGSRAASCGNGLRAAAVFALLSKTANSPRMTVDTVSASHDVSVSVEKGAFYVDASFPPPTLKRGDFLSQKLKEVGIYVDNSRVFIVNCGNEHAVFLDSDKSAENVFGAIEKTNLFPDGINVESAKKIDDERFFCEVFERGSGDTFSCGSGAIAVAAAASLGKENATLEIETKGGVHEIKITPENIILGGLVSPVFSGETIE